MNQTQRKLKIWLGLSITTFLVLILIHLALPALFLLLQIPSFSIGNEVWILRWQNDETGSGIQFNFMILLVISAIAGVILSVIKTGEKHDF